ncbi:hypothetical protein LBMAG55_03760 [Verrucomicrobiota bacterium]|jgi:hypothetical protein|nr:hypothetical protein LBMAG55_03760 [Verrucomicrobiota bacterium]
MNPTEEQRWLALQAEVDALAPAGLDTVLASLPQWDSLAILLVLTHAEQAYHRPLTGAQVRACRTARDLVALLS